MPPPVQAARARRIAAPRSPHKNTKDDVYEMQEGREM